MQRRPFNRGLGSALLGSLLGGFSLAARAQDSGEFVILQARYGTDRNHVDVTARLRELASQDQRFRLVNELFGVDPDPGQQKTLRIFARDRQGGERRFDYRERDWVEGGQFIGWGSGRWGDAAPGRDPYDRGDAYDPSNADGGGRNGRGRDEGEFTILQATYGTGRRQVDVTDRLRELARRDQRFRLTNASFGGIDPDPGRNKVLRILARDRGGQQRTFEYREYATVDGSNFRGWRRGDWGRDRGQGQGRDDGEWGPSRPVGGLVIESASYGGEGRWVDVTQAVRSQVRGDRLELQVGNELFGLDPLPGRRKQLSVTYRRTGEPVNTVRVGERDVLRLP